MNEEGPRPLRCVLLGARTRNFAILERKAAISRALAKRRAFEGLRAHAKPRSAGGFMFEFTHHSLPVAGLVLSGSGLARGGQVKTKDRTPGPSGAPPAGQVGSTVVAKRQSYWTAFSTSGDRFLKENRTFRG